MLNLIGIGLSDEKDITLKGLELIRNSDFVYLENYTSVLQCDFSALEKLYNKKIILADRKMVEQNAEKTILKNAETKNVSFLVIGDVLSATTHIDLIQRAKKMGIKVNIVHNASILTAVAETGLQLYKFGRTTSIPFPEKNFQPETAYDAIKNNLKNELHTLILLDLKPNENKFMTVNEAIKILLEIENKRNEKVFTEKTKIIGCARIGSDSSKIRYETAGKIIKEDFGKPPHCIIVPAKMHFAEEEFLKQFE